MLWEGGGQESELARWLCLAGLATELGTLAAFRRLAREVGSDLLLRSCLSVTLVGWLANGLLLVREAIAPDQEWLVVLMLVVAIVALTRYTWPALGNLGWSPLLLIAGIAGRTKIFHNPLHLLWAIILLVLFLAACALSLTVALGLALMRLHRRLGALAWALGAAELGSAALLAALLLWVPAWVLLAPPANPEEAGASYARLLLAVDRAATTILSVLTALLFAALARRRGAAPVSTLPARAAPSTFRIECQAVPGGDWRPVDRHTEQAEALGALSRLAWAATSGRFRVVDPVGRVLGEQQARGLFQRD
jgi:hypothetical protein